MTSKRPDAPHEESAPKHESPTSIATADRPSTPTPVPEPAPRVIVVEDEPFIALDLERRLSARGFDVVGICDNGADALSLVRTEQPDLVLMDVHIFGPIDGIETARAIGEVSDVPVVFLTAYSDEQTVARSTKTSPYGYVGKPLDEHTLVITLRIALSRHASERRAHLLHEAVQSATMGVALVDVRRGDARVVYANQTFVDIARRPREELVGQPVWLPSAASGDPSEQLLRDALRARRRADGVVLTRGRDDAPLWISVALSPVALPSGAVENMVIFFKDVTAQREAERRLATAERMEIVGRMAAGVAHDFNNLLGVITGFAEFAREADDLSDVRGDIDEILHAAQRGANITRKLLDYSRGVEPSGSGEAELATVVRETLPMLHQLAGSRAKIAFRSNLHAAATVALEPTAIERVLLNLVSNARDALTQGGVIEIELSEAPEQPSPEGALSAVRLTVRDDGVGMPPQVVARVFDPLFSTKPRGHGTGLGLSNVRSLIERASGTIAIDSEPGRGTAVNITLSRITPGARSASLAPQRQAPTGPWCLLVDDEDSLRRACERALSQAGLRVLSAATADAAIALLHERGSELSLLICDMVLGTDSGERVLAASRCVAPHARRLIISGFHPDLVDRGATESHGDPAMRKPFQLSTLVERALDLARR